MVKKSNSFNQTILETIKEPLIVLDSKGQIITANLAFYQKFNVIVESDENQNMWTINDNMFSIPELKKTTQKIFHDGFPVNDLQITHTFSGLDEKTLNITMRRLFSDSIEESLVLITIDDITEITRLYNELKLHNQNLEELVEKKTEELRKKSRLAAIGQTASMVGHDIRNPLQSIEGELYIAKQELEEMPLTPKKRLMLESLSLIQDRIHYINKIVSDLQDFTRPIDPKNEIIDFNNVVAGVLNNIVIPENIILVKNINENLPKLKSDPTCITRILDNLIRNAVQAMPKGGKLVISIKPSIGKIVFSVSDTGVGIPKKVRKKIFEPLFTTKAKGQGFGLAVCLRLVETLGGSINFQSKKNEGTEFIFQLPIT